MNTSDTLLLEAFHHAAESLPFYKDILRKRGVDVHLITNQEMFQREVPIIQKEDIFPKYPLKDLCQNADVTGCVSAIVSSGTSGVFSYGVLTHHDTVVQREVLDTLFRSFFDVKAHAPIIINALPMGVSFASSFPVIPTSVRSDIVLKVIQTFADSATQIILITDPHFLKKVLDEGVSQNIQWADARISCIIGGTSFSDSLTQYLLTALNGGAVESAHANHIFGTMGLTEIGLNIFGATPDLVSLRHAIQENEDHMQQLFKMEQDDFCPELMYCFSPSVHIEIVNPDAHGVGDIVLSHLDTQLKTMLIRYKTGDRGRMVDGEMLAQKTGVTPALPLPIIALYGRATELSNFGITPNAVKELLYRDAFIAKNITGHFIIKNDSNTPSIFVQMKSGIDDIHIPPMRGFPVLGIKYEEFNRDMELNYENKWKHTS